MSRSFANNGNKHSRRSSHCQYGLLPTPEGRALLTIPSAKPPKAQSSRRGRDMIKPGLLPTPAHFTEQSLSLYEIDCSLPTILPPPGFLEQDSADFDPLAIESFLNLLIPHINASTLTEADAFPVVADAKHSVDGSSVCSYLCDNQTAADSSDDFDDDASSVDALFSAIADYRFLSSD